MKPIPFFPMSKKKLTMIDFEVWNDMEIHFEVEDFSSDLMWILGIYFLPFLVEDFSEELHREERYEMI